MIGLVLSAVLMSLLRLGMYNQIAIAMQVVHTKA